MNAKFSTKFLVFKIKEKDLPNMACWNVMTHKVEDIVHLFICLFTPSKLLITYFHGCYDPYYGNLLLHVKTIISFIYLPLETSCHSNNFILFTESKKDNKKSFNPFFFVYSNNVEETNLLEGERCLSKFNKVLSLLSFFFNSRLSSKWIYF